MDSKTARTTMVNSINQRYWTLSTALRIIDPVGSLMPGTPEHNRVTEMILAWMAELETGEVFRMCYDSRRLLTIEGHAWLRNWNENSKTKRPPER